MTASPSPESVDQGLFTTPVVIIAFNRTGVTRRTVEAVRRVRPTQVFLVADGPRATHPEDEAMCAQVRELLTEGPWPGQVHTKFAERNLGLEANIELGLDWVFGQVDRAIVLEDDCVPEPTFFTYCSELLDRYADEPRVWQIAGDNKSVPRRLFHGAGYDFSTWASVWGWATWADRWHAHREIFPRDHADAEERVGMSPRTADAERPYLVLPDPRAMATEAALKHFTQVAGERNGDLRGWDHHWWVTIMSRCGLSATPAYNLIENDGYGEGATHTRAAKDPIPSEPLPLPIVHPARVELNREVEAELELDLLRTDGRLSRLARRLIRPLWMRALVRRVITFPPVWWLVRRVVAR